MAMLFPFSSVWPSFVFVMPCGVTSLLGQLTRISQEAQERSCPLTTQSRPSAPCLRLACYAAHQELRVRTDVVVEAHEGAGELALVLHDDPDRRADAPVNELEGEDRACHCCR